MFAKRPFAQTICTACAVCLLASPFSQAHDLEETSLAMAPEDAAFFSASVHMREAWEDFVNGPFVTKLRATSYVSEVEGEFLRQWNNPETDEIRTAKGMLANPNVKNLLKLADEMFSDEWFIYGGADWCESIEGLMGIQSEIMQAANQGPEAMEAYFADLDKAKIDAIQIPTMVMGFRIDDEDNAELQISALEGIMRLGGTQVDELKPLLQNLRSKELKDGLTLSLTLDSSLIPEEMLEELDGEGPEYEIGRKMLELIEGRTLALAIGVRSKMLLLAIGESADIINEVGSAESTLLDRPEFKYLEEADAENLRGISYVSERFQKANWEANFSNYFTNLTNQFAGVMLQMNQGSPEVEDWHQEILEDAAWMDEKMAALGDRLGATLSWSQKIPGGIEGYTYNWSEMDMENATPIKVLSHAGETPLILLAGKSAPSDAADEIFDYLLDRGDDHLKNLIMVMEDDEEERETAVRLVGKLWPLLSDMYVVLRDKMSPALSENDGLFAVSAEWKISQLPDLPPPNRPLPLPEFASATTVTDRGELVDAFADLYRVMDRMVDVIREVDDDIPADYTIPRPNESDAGLGATRYSYDEFTQDVPIEGFLPQAVIGDDVMLMGYSDRQVQSMLETRELLTRPAWLTDETPVGMVAFVDFAGIFGAIRPWAEFGFQMSGMPMDAPLSEEELVPSPNDLLEIWDCLEAAGQLASTTTVGTDGEPTVSRFVWIGE